MWGNFLFLGMRMKTTYFTFLTIFILFPFIGRATHIVGGEMTYTCLGPNAQGVNEFEIRLTVYRDCQNGVPPFDDIADIAIYSADSILLDSILVAFDPMIDDTITAVLSNPCLVVPPDVCVHTTTYTAIKALPFRVGGYLLAYQRCCRNRTINNIVKPLSTGATFDIAISDLALSECNSSAKFVDWPPIYICANEPIDFDHSAIDVDGDSIVYKLCTPITGGDSTTQLAAPTAFEQTKPAPVVWIDPPYNVNNMLNNPPTGDLLMIDSETGFLTGVPNLTGQFVVGICIEEYRDGILISTTRRDFQYNVGECGSSVSSFFLPTILCDGLSVDFNNLSQNADDYLWMFNDPGNPGATSMQEDPTFVFSDTGTYTVILISEPGNECVDTSEQTVNLQLNSLSADFSLRPTSCTDSTTYLFTDASADTLFDIISWNWTVMVGNTLVDSSSQQSPSFVFYDPVVHSVTLTVIAANGCEESRTFTFTPRILTIDLLQDTLGICNQDSVELVGTPNDMYNYEWSPAAGLSDPTSSNPMASPMQTTTYSVTVTDNSQFCSIIREITVVVPEPIEILLPEDTVICESEVTITAISDQATSYSWSLQPVGGAVISATATATLAPTGGSQLFYLRVFDEFNCPALDSIRVTENQVNIETDGLPVICQGEDYLINASNLDPSDMLSYEWRPPANLISGAGSPNAAFNFPNPGNYQVFLLATNQFSCQDSALIELTVLDTTSQLGFLTETQCSGFSVQFINTSVNAPFYQWNFGDPANPTAGSSQTNPVYTYSDTGTYTVVLTYAVDVNCPDTLIKTVRVTDPQINVDFDWSYEECSDSIVILFSDLSVNSQGIFTDRQWIFSNGASARQQDTSLTLFSSQDLIASLIVFSDDGCIDTLTEIIPIRLIDANINSSITACPGTLTSLNPNGDPSYNYSWSPATGLSDPGSANPEVMLNQSTTYSVTISDFAGTDTCQVIRTVDVFVPPLIDLMVSGGDSSCTDEFTLQATSNVGSLEWFENDISIGTGPSIIVNSPREGIYTVVATDNFNCSLSDTLRVFNLNPMLRDTTFFLCASDTLTLSLPNEIPDDELTYSWEPASTILSGANTANPLVAPTMTTLYTATVTNQYGCMTTATALVQLIPNLPILQVTGDPDTIFSGETTQLMATQDSTYTYEWSPGATLSDPIISNPTATPEETTTYTVEITDGNGCSNIAALTIVVISSICDEPFIFLPNAFSPNGDGENDVLRVLGFNVDEMYLAVFNRWGQKVFESEDQSIGWDGTFEGKQLPADVFGFYLRVRCLNGLDYFKKGNVSLLR